MPAVIDLGTNSARLLIGRVEGGKAITLQHHRQVTRMGAGIREQGLISQEAMERTGSALKGFRHILMSQGVEDVIIIGTSAARRALNRDELAQLVADIFQKELRVLDGREEARLSFEGAVGSLAGLPLPSVPVVVDIGGGSVEICTNVKGNIQALSFEIGAVRCTESPISKETMITMLRPAVEMLQPTRLLTLVGVGGTITTLAAMDQRLAVYDPKRIQGYRLHRHKVNEMLRLVDSLSLDQRKALPGLEPDRADIIVAGTGILLIIMDLLKADVLIVSEADLLYGALMELIDSRHG